MAPMSSSSPFSSFFTATTTPSNDVVIPVTSPTPTSSEKNKELPPVPEGGNGFLISRDIGQELHSDVNTQYEFYSNPNSRPPSSMVDIMNNDTLKRTSAMQGASSNATIEDDEELARRLVREQEEEKLNAPNGKSGSTLPQVLHDPLSRSKLKGLKANQPYFLGLVTVAQVLVVMLLVSCIFNLQWTGSFIQTSPFNIMIGPTPGVLIQVGARFVPCIRNTTLNSAQPQILCPAGISSNTTALDATTGQMAPSCTIEQICGMGGFNGGPPNQWFRFITPIFLHGGWLHLLVNMLFQVQTGFQLERDFGWWRIALIYMISGIGGFIFGGNFNGLTPSVGCSGALFGLMACLVIDLFQNWKMIVNPMWELIKLSFTIIVSFLIGMLPYIDNFAHIGGFFCGVLAGLIFMPTIYYSKRDKIIKIATTAVAVPVLVIVYAFLIRGFYVGNSDCPWCKYLNCIPGLPWCDTKWDQGLLNSGGAGNSSNSP